MKDAVLLQTGVGWVEDLMRTTDTWHREYARHHNMDFHAHYGAAQTERHCFWDCVVKVREMLEAGYEWVFYLDADSVIVDPDHDLRRAIPEGKHLGLALDLPVLENRLPELHQLGGPLHFNTGVVFARNSAWTKRFYRELWEDSDLTGTWGDQNAMNALIARKDNLSHLHEMDLRYNQFGTRTEPYLSRGIYDAHVLSFHGADPDYKKRAMGDIMDHFRATRREGSDRALVAYSLRTGRIKYVIKPIPARVPLPREGLHLLKTFGRADQRRHRVIAGCIFER